MPCGIPDRPVTSLAAEGLTVTMAEVRDAVIAAAETVWGRVEDIQKVTDGATSTPSRPRDRWRRVRTIRPWARTVRRPSP